MSESEEREQQKDKYAKYRKYKFLPGTRRRFAWLRDELYPGEGARAAVGSAVDTIRNIRIGSAAAAVAGDLLGQGGKKRKYRKKRKSRKIRKSRKRRKSKKKRKRRKSRRRRK